MKKLKVKKDVSCMACLECVNACSTAFYKVADPGKACIQIIEKMESRNPWSAYSVENVPRPAKPEPSNRNMVDKKLCTGCGKCAEVCPFHVMLKVEESPTASKCIACGICAKACPMDVLEVVES